MTKIAKSKSKKDINKSISIIDILVLGLAMLFVVSVVDNAQALVADGIKNAPASYLAILATILIAIRYYNDKKISTINIVSVTIILTSVVIWTLGLGTIGLY